MVNRIWQYHFGKGLVSTPSDFGVRGASPSHPELLDWLATEFVANGWSMKKLHRQILLSSVYRQSTAPSSEAQKRDPENKLLSHMNRRRLFPEEIRDGMLQASGGTQPEDGRPAGGTAGRQRRIIWTEPESGLDVDRHRESGGATASEHLHVLAAHVPARRCLRASMRRTASEPARAANRAIRRRNR